MTTDALREFYFSDDPDLVEIDTVEIRHPAFVDDDGNATVVRVANDASGFLGTLDADSPVGAGQTVMFSPSRFDLLRPDSPDQGLPKSTLQIENVTQLLSPYMDQGVSTTDPVEVSLRSYLSDDFSQPASVFHGLTVQTAKSNVLRVEIDLGFDDLINASFHDMIYQTGVFAGLVR